MFTLNFYRLFNFLFDSSIGGGITGSNPTRKMYKTYDGNTNVSIQEMKLRVISECMLVTGDNNREENWNRKSCGGILDGLADEASLLSQYYYKTRYNNDSGFDQSWYYGMRQRYPTYMLLGSGSTAPKKTDYKMESFIGSDKLICTDNSYSSNENFGDDTDEIMVCTWDFQNVTEEPIQVSEVGLVSCSNDQVGSNYCLFLIYREVLASPVTIQPNGKYSFSVRIGC